MTNQPPIRIRSVIPPKPPTIDDILDGMVKLPAITVECHYCKGSFQTTNQKENVYLFCSKKCLERHRMIQQMVLDRDRWLSCSFVHEIDATLHEENDELGDLLSTIEEEGPEYNNPQAIEDIALSLDRLAHRAERWAVRVRETRRAIEGSATPSFGAAELTGLSVWSPGPAFNLPNNFTCEAIPEDEAA
jgi:hypothetical protein